MLKSYIINNKKILLYFAFSVIVTIVDVITVYLLKTYTGLDIVISNSIGVIVGFIMHYFLSSKKVFDSEYGIKGFMVYFVTFIFGLVMADMIIWFFYNILESGFLISKFMSIIVPFFVMYYIRKSIYDKLREGK